VRRTELRERLDPEHGGVGSSAVAAAAAARQEALTVKQAQLAAVLRAVDDNRDRLNQIESELLERRQVHYCIVTLSTSATAVGSSCCCNFRKCNSCACAVIASDAAGAWCSCHC
jgi:hypothetical protein